VQLFTVPTRAATASKSWVEISVREEGCDTHGFTVAPKEFCSTVTPRVTLFLNYLHYKLSQASSAMVNQVVEVRNQNSKSGVRI
jgi:hypothetical protein